MAKTTREIGKLLGIAIARTNTDLFGNRSVALRSLLFLGLGSIIYAFALNLSGAPDLEDQVMAEAIIWGSYVAVPAVTIYVIVFLWNLWLSPYERMRQRLSEMAGQIDLIEQFARDQKAEAEAELLKFQAKRDEVSGLINTLFDVHHADIVQEARIEYDRAQRERIAAEGDRAAAVQQRTESLQDQHEALHTLRSEFEGKLSQMRALEEGHFTQPLLGLVDQIGNIEARIITLEAKLSDLDG